MRLARIVLASACVALVTACSVPGPGEAPDGIHDPWEETNRRVHQFNRSLDGGVVSGAGGGFVEVVPPPVRQGLFNLSDTVSTPRTVVNQLLQLRLDRAARNTLRFSTNVLLGFGGLVDVASQMGLPIDESDFGETLHVWGAAEGAYLELPLLGPSTQRDAAGEVVDLFLNPLDPLLTRGERRLKTGVTIAATVAERGELSDTIDSVLYESADSYRQLRLIYLQNRRFELGLPPPGGEEPDPLTIDTEGF